MNKTLHKKLTAKHLYEHTSSVVYTNGDCLPTVFLHEMKLLQDDAKELMQPRPEALARLLNMAREV